MFALIKMLTVEYDAKNMVNYLSLLDRVDNFDPINEIGNVADF